ncbi:transporter substrate-binding domain-containing protein [Bacillus haynesii]|uniref:transporter substrate-binding domain-containing protein n=1 Tax=Bacillus haynesii TaxID=1925021 RepID=UPI001594A10F|nr:transporter substrate-binding domain-containing protein [Bacillus haynesii]NVB35411.1 transporter substrate-binding domain-containing protein [Bacillus licheniformis]MCY7778926.1 transporter substrate-binding domain-containing protein [Bacillus haynesii]MCY8225672.1 transporter substrate-binding domain-containing protein [Bacillus haynesii]MCY8672303.1 transporter substrate-binding domain-containing protein [Bacillus haynesii]MEC0672439.1 transporter substrate-binding domain-containing prot
MNKLHTYKRITLLITVLALALITAACSTAQNKAENQKTAWDEIKEKGKIVVATSGTLYPTSYHDTDSGKDKLTGYEVEVIREAAKRLDLNVEFKEMGFDGMLTAVGSGQVDAAANDITMTDDRKEKFLFSTPYKYSFGTAIVRKKDLSGIHKLEDLKGKKAAGAATTVYMDIARKYGAEEVIYDNATNDQFLKDVANGRTDVILNDYYLQKLALAAMPDLDLTIHPDLKYYPHQQGMIMKKGNTELKKQFDKTIDEMLKDGTIKKISKKFFGGADVSKKQDIDYIDVDVNK